MDDTLAEARDNMVDGQLRPNKVTDRRILDVMRRLPRERFIPSVHRLLAYTERDVPVAPGRVMLAPVTVARMVQSLGAITAQTKVLVIGAGYAAALLGAMGAEIVTLEEDPAIIALTGPALTEFGSKLTMVQGPLRDGWHDAAPYDAILIDGAVASLPPLYGQLREHPAGLLVTILARPSRTGVAVLAERTAAGLAHRPLFDCTAMAMPQFAEPPHFQF